MADVELARPRRPVRRRDSRFHRCGPAPVCAAQRHLRKEKIVPSGSVVSLVTDSELIARAVASDDRAAFGELVHRHQSAVRHFLRHLTRGNAALADDLAQEAFIQAWRGLARFRSEGKFSTWLLGIAHNHWRNARRRQSDVSLDAEGGSESSVAAGTALSDLQHDLSAALRQLPSDEQLVLHLSYQQGLSHGEIATLLDQPLGSVKTQIARSKEKLRHLLAAWNPQN
jgi:RNA polymerase sigma factor (sigma-70 family)